MWCPTCQADVAAEAALDNRHASCTTCGSELATASLTTTVKTREARELLERWASQRTDDRPASVSGSRERRPPRPHFGGVNLEGQAPEPAAASPSFRFDAPHPGVRAATRDTVEAHSHAAESPTGERSARRSPYSRRWPEERESPRVDDSHHDDVPTPHFDREDLIAAHGRPTNWAAFLGQLLAYLGVALLTVGSSLVLWSYFGGPAHYAPTGWLTTTAGQMLLFLGVVTLVAGGIEQSNEEVKVRIERIGERMIRIEKYSREHALRGPYIPAEAYGPAGPASVAESRLGRHADRVR
jgi:hypothetical protein